MGVAELGLCLLVLGLGAGSVIGIALLVQATHRRTDAAINLTLPTHCPRCGAVPRNAQQLLWGGWTCSGCGVELDTWGRVKTGP